MHTISLGSAWSAAARIGIRTATYGLVIANVLRGWIERARSRRVLATLDDRMLNDIGLSRGEIDLETRKPFWRA
jgi:uncharacterized protein YjiS (DUF1127 family)